MKRATAQYYLAFLMLILVCPGLRSQDLFVTAAGERIQACSDRTMYVSGEKVLFSVVLFNTKDPSAPGISRIFYAELINPDGKKITGGKFPLQNSAGQGCLTIPEETISGIYFLKFYTRFMRNLPTEDYKYIVLKIINPSRTEVLPGHGIPDTANQAGNNMKGPAGDFSLVIFSAKKTFSPGDEIRIKIRDNAGEGMVARLCLSVIPQFTFKDSFSPQPSKPDSENGAYFPETRGIALSGKLNDKGSGKPVRNTRVNLSIIGDKDIQVTRSDSSGRFLFALPDHHGNKDIFLCAENLTSITPEILIDNDFCSRPVNLPSPLFTLNEEEMKAAYKLAVNTRLTSMFGEETVRSDSSGEETYAPFYGEPAEVVVLDKYIELPTLGEYFTELSLKVSIRRAQGKKYFKFFTTQPGMPAYNPLVLVDWVAVDDIEKILAMSPREIERIELVNSPYMKGNITFGGIISFVSKKKDFAGIDLPASGTFVNYSFMEECTQPVQLLPSAINIPDSRNTVYWNPDVRTNDDGIAELSFTAPGTPGKYSILLRGMSITGEVLLTKEMIVVTKN